jgi:hypothetical protein
MIVVGSGSGGMERGVGGPARWAFLSSNIRKTPRHGC